MRTSAVMSRVVFVIGFLAADGQRAIGMLECGNAGLRVKIVRNTQENVDAGLAVEPR